MPLISAGVRSALRELRHELSIQRYHKASIKNARRFRGRSDLKLHLGCGSRYKAGWINIDLQQDADLQLDVREDLPFEAGTVSIIYSEHFLEHLEYPAEVVHLLRESLRVLEPGGIFSVGVPDAEEVLLQYAQGKLPALLQEWSRDKNLQWFPRWVWTTPIHLVNFFFRQGREHKYAYDFETLARVLKEAGFVDIGRRDFNPDLDSEDRRDGTLYVDARKE
ncbi:MAG: methyltransferase domain-containing protein [Gammaproteobacteria bacterium]|nr:methyltransferase domain-containing protein [Gammaproteobacteria bacterium]